LEALKAKGYDVLFLTTPVDQFIANEFYEFEKTPIIFADKGDLKLDDDETVAKEKQEAAEKEYKAVTDKVAKHLDAYVREVRVSTRLTDSACCLVQDPQALNPAMRRMLEAMGQNVPEEKRILEINPSHPCIQRLATTADEAKVADTIDLLYAQACLAEGSLPPDPIHFNRLVAALMQ
jgi:molecular chaperone HtpG